MAQANTSRRRCKHCARLRARGLAAQVRCRAGHLVGPTHRPRREPTRQPRVPRAVIEELLEPPRAGEPSVLCDGCRRARKQGACKPVTRYAPLPRDLLLCIECR